MDQVYTDQEAYTIFTYGNIGQDPPTLHDDKTKVPPPPPPTKKDTPITKWGVPRPPSPPGATASTDDSWGAWQGGNDTNSQQPDHHHNSGRRRSASAPRQRYCHAWAQNGECAYGSLCKHAATHTHTHMALRH